MCPDKVLFMSSYSQWRMQLFRLVKPIDGVPDPRTGIQTPGGPRDRRRSQYRTKTTDRSARRCVAALSTMFRASESPLRPAFRQMKALALRGRYGRCGALLPQGDL